MLDSAPTIDELVTSFANELKAGGAPSDCADEIARQLVTECAVREVPASRGGTVGLLVLRYAIRKDDIKLFEMLADVLAASSDSLLTGHPSESTAIVRAVLSIAKVVRALVKRGAVLDRDTVHILSILRLNAPTPKAKGLSPEEVLRIKQRTKPECDLAWVENKLKHLSEVPTLDGATANLASPDSSGRWRSHA